MLTTKLRNQFGLLILALNSISSKEMKNDQYLQIFLTEEYIALSLSKVSMVENIRLGIEDLQIIRHKATIV